jgi:hypothetical protein
MTKPTKPKPKPKPKKVKSVKDEPIFTPLPGNLVCECGCGRVADTADWDTGVPLSLSCLFQRSTVVTDVSPP